MKRVNLMTDASRFRSEARVYLRWWSFGLLAAALILAPVSIWRCQTTRSVRAECEAMEASYEPIRRLVKLNRDLRNDAGVLVKNQRLELELSQNRPVSALLKVVSAAVAASHGQLFIEHMAIAEHFPQGGAPPINPVALEEKIVINAIATATYDIAPFAEALKKEPIKTVKVLSGAVASPQGADRMTYKLECAL